MPFQKSRVDIFNIEKEEQVDVLEELFALLQFHKEDKTETLNKLKHQIDEIINSPFDQENYNTAIADIFVELMDICKLVNFPECEDLAKVSLYHTIDNHSEPIGFTTVENFPTVVLRGKATLFRELKARKIEPNPFTPTDNELSF